MSGDGDKRSGLHHNILSVENPLSAKPVNDPVPLGVHQELLGAGELEDQEK